HEIRPGRLEGIGFLAVESYERGPEQQVRQFPQRAIGQPLRNERPAQRPAERQDLGVVAGLVAEQGPDARLAAGLRGGCLTVRAGCLSSRQTALPWVSHIVRLAMSLSCCIRAHLLESP